MIMEPISIRGTKKKKRDKLIEEVYYKWFSSASIRRIRGAGERGECGS